MAVATGSLVEPIVGEFQEEVGITRRILQRVPGDKLDWRPHAKSMTLGQLAWHIATVPGGLARILDQNGFDVTQGSFVPPQPKDKDEILSAFEESVRSGESFLKGLSDDRALGAWRLAKGERELFVRPRIEVLRSIMLNHWYHHRGQLSVYLRLLDVAVPVVYGRSADEDPFA